MRTDLRDYRKEMEEQERLSADYTDYEDDSEEIFISES
jgi:hypothetical protein